MKSGLLLRLSGSAADQALMSLISFASSMALIRMATKSEYGLYLIFFSVIYLAQGIQNALILSPFTTRVSGGESSSNGVALYIVTKGLFAIALVFGIMSTLGLNAYLSVSKISTSPYILYFFAFALLGWLSRENTRVVQYVEGNVKSAVLNSTVYATIVLCYLLYSFINFKISLDILFLFIGAAGIFTFAKRPASINGKLGWRNELSHFFELGKWAIIGAVGAWVTGNFYPFFVAANFDIRSVADLGASKLMVMPLALLIPAWSSIFRPIIGRLHTAKKQVELNRIIKRSTAIAALVLMLYALLILLLNANIVFVFGENYSNLTHLVIAWCIYYFFFASRTFLQSVLLCSRLGYKNLSLISLCSFLIFFPSILIGSKFGPIGIIGSLIFTEVFQSLAVSYRVIFTENFES